jgi:hypothetical protein
MTLANGLVVMRPTSVTIAGSGSQSATINVDGSVSCSLVSLVRLNGVFTATYDNYMINIRHLGTQNISLNLALSANNVDDSTFGNYVTQRTDVFGTTVSSNRTNDEVSGIAATGNIRRSGSVIYLYGPYLTQPTVGRGASISGESGAYLRDAGFTHNQSTSYDGVSFGPTMSQFSGLVTVYGLAD